MKETLKNIVTFLVYTLIILICLLVIIAIFFTIIFLNYILVSNFNNQLLWLMDILLKMSYVAFFGSVVIFLIATLLTIFVSEKGE